MHEKHQDIEEPCEAKVSSTVLKTSGTGDSLAEFNQDEVFGFHSLEFDDQLLAAAGCQVQTTYDVLCEMRAAAGFSRDWTKPLQSGEPSRKDVSFSLELMAQLNLGYGKMGWGNPPELWQQGHKAQVKARCLHDVKLVKGLLELSSVISCTEGRLLDPNTGRWLYLKPLGVPADAYRSLDAV